jgi:oligosaccharyltransferase complex subunit alpha (ribophorin I)
MMTELTGRSPTPFILSYPEIPTTYTRDNTVTRAGATLTLGPFHNLPPTLGSASSVEQAPFSVHYEHKEAVVALRSLKRAVEVSHWGANVNTQDELDLVNIGPK